MGRRVEDEGESERRPVIGRIGVEPSGEITPGLTHHNSESGLAGKPCLLVKPKLLDHMFTIVR
jgi:hypothetical protein